ncbi:MAG TPA: PEPxxWA-CTERM sorting domain-containing protein [Phenylobacterium sp.]|nr:PEPxxWA-CTERM sorting domain-containing protein [Phenylobacterium sp.]
MSRMDKPAARPAIGGVCGLALMASAAGAPAHAADLYGAAAIVTNRFCPGDVATCSVAGGFAPGVHSLQPAQFFGGYQAESSVSVSLLNGASAAASVQFGGDYLPTVGVGSWSGADTRTGVTVASFRSFTYTGDQAIDLALAGQLHFIGSGDIDGPAGAGDYAGDGTFNVAFGIMKVSTVAAAFGPGTDAAGIVSNSDIDFPDCGGAGVVAAGGYNSAGVSAGEHTQSIGLTSACGGGAILLNPGDSFVVIATLQALSNRGGFVDATHTFAVQFDGAHTLIHNDDGPDDTPVGADFFAQNFAVGAAVPEPAAWALMIAGFGLTGATLRRRRLARVGVGRD